MKFGTMAVHAGVKPDPATGAIMTPIYQTSTYVQAAPGDHKGYEYSRTKNPTRSALEEALAILEGGKHSFCFGSGMAASDAIIKLLLPGDEVITVRDLYGGSYRMFTQIYEPLGINFSFHNLNNPNALKDIINSKTKMIWIETPTNPLLNIVDIKAIADIAKENNILLVVDNTFATPCLQNPLALGADIVVHSITKYLGGHSDVVMGGVVTSDPVLAERIGFIQKSCGAVCGPQDAFLVLRGLKTLHLRMERCTFNAKKVVEFLQNNEKVDKVYYPGLVSHMNHEVAKKQMKDFGGMVSFTLKGDNVDNALKILSGTKLFALAESLGGVESLIGHPVTMTHASIPKEEREKAGIKDSLIRLSVGIEDIDDLLEDLSQSFS